MFQEEEEEEEDQKNALKIFTSYRKTCSLHSFAFSIFLQYKINNILTYNSEKIVE